MARTAGRDVVLTLMDTVKELRSEMDDVHRQLDLHSMRMDFIGEAMLELAESTRTLGKGFQRMERLLGKVAAGLSDLAGSTSSRFDELEARVGALESKR